MSKRTALDFNNEDLKKLKEGEIIVDKKSGKKYRVVKSIAPLHLCGGPLGYGDPDDHSLRQAEANVIIPKLMNTYLNRNDCSATYKAMVDCLTASGKVGFTQLTACVSKRDLYDTCRLEKFNDPLFREKITEQFLKDRSHFRRTGNSTKNNKTG